MNATFDLKESLKLLRLLKTGRGPGTQWLRVTAIEEYLIFEAGQGVVWVPALVLEPGAFSTRRTPFNKVLASFTGSKTLTLQADAGRFRINSFSGQILDYDPYPARPKGFEPIEDESESKPPGANSADTAAIAKEDRVAQPSAPKPLPPKVEDPKPAAGPGVAQSGVQGSVQEGKSLSSPEPSRITDEVPPVSTTTSYITGGIWDASIEIAAQTIEKGGTVTQSVANAITCMRAMKPDATAEHDKAIEDHIRGVLGEPKPSEGGKPAAPPPPVKGDDATSISNPANAAKAQRYRALRQKLKDNGLDVGMMTNAEVEAECSKRGIEVTGAITEKPSLLRDAAIIAARYINEGIKDVAEFGARWRKEFGKTSNQDIFHIWKAGNEEYTKALAELAKVPAAGGRQLATEAQALRELPKL
jgi:hypothetical protein